MRPSWRPGHHLVEAESGGARELEPPRLGELFADLGVVERLVAGHVGGVGARVVQALDVVLAAERVQPGGLVAQVPGHEHEVGERPDVVHAAGVLRDPERVEDRRVALARVLARRGDDVGGRDAGHLLGLLGRVAGDDLGDGLHALGVLGDVGVVLEALLQDHVQHRVDQPDVGAGPELQVALGELRQPDLARVGDDERCAVAHRLLHAEREHGVRLGRVRPDDEDEAGVLDLGDRVSGGASA